MHPEVKQAARAYLDAHRTYHENRAAHWPRPHSDMPQYLAMLDAMCDLSTAARKHYPFLCQRDRFHRHISRLTRKQRFEPYPNRDYRTAVVAPHTIPYTWNKEA